MVRGLSAVGEGQEVLNDVKLGEGDGAAVSGERRIGIAATEDGEVLAFDLA